MAWIANRTSITRYLPTFEVDEKVKRLALDYMSANPDYNYNNKPFPLEVFPKQMVQTSSHKALPDVLGSGTLHAGLSQTFKDIVESFEPDLHQFQPVDVITKSGTPTEMPYFYFRNLQCLHECVDYDASILSDRSKPGRLVLPERVHFKDDELAMRREMIDGRHFWNIKQHTQTWFFSEELKAEVERQGLKRLHYVHIREV
ncbi:MAG: DUF1629 domain-containing protein [Pseudomonadota bacterium]